MKIADFRVQSTAPDSPSEGVVGLYINSKGVLVTKTPDGIVSGVGTNAFLNTNISANIVTGGAGYLATGYCFAGTPAGTGPLTGLTNPSVWLNIAVSGVKYAIPAYSLR